MKTKILLISIVLIVSTCWTSRLNAQDVFNLATTDNIATVLSTYTGSNVVLVIPSGYTNPQGATAITLPLLTSGTKLTIRGDGTMPTLTLKTLTLPTGFNLAAFKFENLTLTGASTDPTANYVINVATGIALNIDTVAFSGCTINTFRSLIRFQSTNTTFDQKANYILINNCKVSNFVDYGLFYNNKTGGLFGPIVAKKSTFYGIGQNVFMCQTNTTSVDISDCTFDNAVLTSAKYIVDLNAQVSPVTIKNCIFGTSIAGSKCIRTAGTVVVTNCYRTTNCTLGDSIKGSTVTGSIIAYSGSSASLFKTPNTSTPGTAFVGTADYTVMDNSFQGNNNAGDPRWYTPTAVFSPTASSTVISYNGSEISLNEAQDINIYSVTGSLLKSAKKVSVLSVANLPKGIYLVKAGSVIQKLMLN